MKNLFLIIALTGATVSQGQVVKASYQDARRANEQKIESLKVAFLTQEIGLTTDEAQRFWPIYNDIKEEQDKLYDEKKKLMYDMGVNFASTSDAEAQVYVDRMFEMEEKLNESHFEARNRKIIKIIGPKRFLILKKSEREFRVKLIKEYRGRSRD